MKWRVLFCLALATIVASMWMTVSGQPGRGFTGSFQAPAIDYQQAPLADAVSQLARRVDAGDVHLSYDEHSGYLSSVLRELGVSVDSQLLVFSQTSLLASQISPKNPRAVYFNDRVAVAWVRGSQTIEMASQDPRQGIIFQRLERTASGAPSFARSTECLRCHVSWETFAVPGLMVLSTGPEDAAGYATGGAVDDRHPVSMRWGGWFVTGRSVPAGSLGTRITAPPWAAATFDATDYLSPHSDVVALMTLEHQARAANLLTYLGWETRIGASRARVDEIVRDLVDDFLFVDAAPLPGRIVGSSTFAERFASLGPADRRGRSLRQFDLTTRLMRYPCSYMIYTPAFDALPDVARYAVYDRIAEVLSGRNPSPVYTTLSGADRQAVLEILRDTKPEFASRASF
ncbi:MAG: hypothetical protein LBQ09_00280 [Acidobacteriaceae bacterium]|jgi:hypothetical protein|nr:hypothetical protein [Acidobacteriaceae bacterium]